jgi:hypothetical protein
MPLARICALRPRGGAKKADDAVAAAQAELNRLAAAAAAAKKAVDDKAKADQEKAEIPEAGEMGNLANSAVGSFSAATLAASGAGFNSADERTAKNTQEMKDALRDMHAEMMQERREKYVKRFR